MFPFWYRLFASHIHKSAIIHATMETVFYTLEKVMPPAILSTVNHYSK